jgi:hypothetical protein
MADLADLIAAPERVREVPAEMIPGLIGAVELRAAGLERLKAELWASLLCEQPDKTADRVSHSNLAAVRSEASKRSMLSRASHASGQRGQSVPSTVSEVSKRSLMTVRQFCAGHPAFTEGSVRWLLFNRDTNGLAVALVKKGRRIWIDADAFFEWLERSEPAAHAPVG